MEVDATEDLKMNDCLELKNFNHLGSILKHFDEDEINRDLVIRTEQGYIQCHKLLLAAASPLFYQILGEIPSEDPALVIMTEFPNKEVKQMISSIYALADSESDITEVSSENLLKFFSTSLPIVLDRRFDAQKEEIIDAFAENLNNVESNFFSNEPMVILPEICEDNLDYFGGFSDAEEKKEETTPRTRSIAKGKKRKKLKKKVLKKRKQPEDLKDPDYSDKPKTIPKTESPKKLGRPRKYPMPCPLCGVLLERCKMKGRHHCVPTVTRDDTKENSDTEIICHLCGIRFLNKASLSIHLHMKCENVCEVCKQVFLNRTEVREHMFTAHHKIIPRRNFREVEKLYHCDQCEKSYTKEAQLKLHIKTHSELVERFQCQECGNFLSSKLALKKHVALHQPPGYPCPICGKLFHNKAYLSRHAVGQHGDRSIKRHKCDMCDKAFNNKAALDGHRNWHLNLKPYQCRWCDRTYQNSSNCSAHERKSHRELYASLAKNANRRVQTKEEFLVADMIHETTIVHV